MKDLFFVISLTTGDNDYQIEQAVEAEKTASDLGVKVEIVYADNDAVTQSQQLLKAIQFSGRRPDAIILESVSITALPQVAKAAASADIGWVVLNGEPNYLAELRDARHVPAFAITTDHEEVGRIQGRQVAALLPAGGCVLQVQGPSDSVPARQRTAGMAETKPANIQVRAVKGQWTEASSFRAVSSWLSLSISRDTQILAVVAQDDSMAIGARKAFQQHTTGADRDRLLALPFLGCDGMPDTGQTWVRNGTLAATVVIPANTGLALKMLVKSFRNGAAAPERTLTVPASYPSLSELSRKKLARPTTAGGK